MIQRLAVAISMTVMVGWVLVRASALQLAGVDLVVTEVADSQSYFVYDYELSNSSSSLWSISSVRLDISATSGLPPNLAATGEVDVIPPFPASGTPHAEVGPITPSGWRAILSPLARLTWTPPLTRSFSGDSVPPGTSKGGFGLRSSYLPGITSVEAIPTTESCCRTPVDTTGGERIYQSPTRLAVIGSTVVPRYQPSEVSLDLLQSQLFAVCTDPLWIDDSALCGALADSLDATEDRLAGGDVSGARDAIAAAGDIVYANREPFGAVESNAEWLLRLNLEQLLENLPEPGLPLWTTGVSYVVGDEVSHQGLDYRCRQSHTSQSGWEPPNVYALWERINTGGQWAPQVIYAADDIATYQGIDYRAIQGHQSQVGWEPPSQPALWEEVN